MTEVDFLKKLYKQKKLQFVDKSDEICSSYLNKANDSFRSAKLLVENGLLENAVTMAYYAMYNALTAALFKAGIKCENHTASIILLRALFEQKELAETVGTAKKERIDKQYYIAEYNQGVSLESAEKLNKDAEDFILQMKTFMKSWNTGMIDSYINKLQDTLGIMGAETKK